jgi:hypothetical protein
VLKEPKRAANGSGGTEVVDFAPPGFVPAPIVAGGKVPPVLHDRTNAPSTQPSASETAYAGPAPVVPLPGRMITATLYDKDHKFIVSKTEPLYDDVDADMFYGVIDGSSINWNEGDTVVEVSVRLGTKLDPQGNPQGGVPIEKWVHTNGKGRARFVLVEIDNATLLERPEDPHPVGDDATTKSGGSGASSATSRDGGAASPATASGTGTTSARGDGTDTTENALDDHAGATREPGHDGPRTDGKVSKGGGGDRGFYRGTSPDLSLGGTAGQRDGERLEAGYFYDPDRAQKGGSDNDGAPDEAVVGGMVGGDIESSSTDGIPEGGWFDVVSIPRSVAAAASLGMILLDADITGIGDDAVKLSMKLGRKAAGKGGAIAKTIANKVERLAKRETAKLAQSLSREAKFLSKTADEQAKILAEAEKGIVDEANRRLAADLDKKIADHKAAAAKDATRTDGYAEDFANQDLANAQAAQDARDSLPDLPPVATDASKVESPALEGSPYHPDAVADRIHPPYEPNAAHDPKSPDFNPRKTPEPSDAAEVYATAKLGKVGTWYGKGKEGWYQFFWDRQSVVHFSGIIEEHKVPKAIREAIEQ